MNDMARLSDALKLYSPGIVEAMVDSPDVKIIELPETVKKVSLEQVLAVKAKLFAQSNALVQSKGADYNRRQQQGGDTLFNLRVAKLLGIVDSETQSVLVRLSDKLMRLSSLCRDPAAVPAVKDESVRDTIVDVFNYAAYLYVFYLEARGELQSYLAKEA